VRVSYLLLHKFKHVNCNNIAHSIYELHYVLNDQGIEIRFRCMELVFLLKGLRLPAEELELFNPYQGQLPWDKAAGHDVKHRPHLEPTPPYAFIF